jgi:hypothetical protein
MCSHWKLNSEKTPFFLVGSSPSLEVCSCPFISCVGRSPTQARTSPDPSPPAKPIWPWRAPLGLGGIGVRAQETCAAPYKARRPRPPPAPRRHPACAQCEAPRRLLPEPPSAPPPRLKTNRRRRPPIPAGPVVLRPRWAHHPIPNELLFRFCALIEPLARRSTGAVACPEPPPPLGRPLFVLSRGRRRGGRFADRPLFFLVIFYIFSRALQTFKKTP